MFKKCVAAATIAVAMMTATISFADVYNDNVGSSGAGGDLHEFFFDQGFNHLDLVSVTVTNDSSFLYFDIELNADLDATNWGKYLVGIDTGANAGVNGNPWGRNVDWTRGITDFLGSWADDGGSGAGAEFHQFDGADWVLTDATYLSGTEIMASDAGHAAGIQSLAVSLSALGLSVGDTIDFDVFSTGGGGGDPGVDHLSRFDWSTDDWANQSASGDFLRYTITGVPEPGSMGLFALAGVLGLVRRRR